MGREQARWKKEKKTHPQIQDVFWLLDPPVLLLLCKKTKKPKLNVQLINIFLAFLSEKDNVEQMYQHLCTFS